MPAAGGRYWYAKLDMYRKVPGDLLEGSRQGNIISWIVIVVITILIYKETAAFLTTELKAESHLDSRYHHYLSSGGSDSIISNNNDNNNNNNNAIQQQQQQQQGGGDDRIRVTFNITMMDLKCDYVGMDVVSVLGNNQNVTTLVSKIPIDANGILQRYERRNLRQHDIDQPTVLHDVAVTKSIEELHKSGEDAISLTPQSLQFALNENYLVFLDYYASWCSHCQALAPTWETLGKLMRDAAEQIISKHNKEYTNNKEYDEAIKLHVPVLIAKIDCVTYHEFCIKQRITGYPTLRLFVNGKIRGDYRGQRTLIDLIQFLRLAEEDLEVAGKLNINDISVAMEKRLNISSFEERHWKEALDRTLHHHGTNWIPNDHPGCQISGSILINRVPGNFHIQAFSSTHDLAPHMTNVSHEVHTLSFSPVSNSNNNNNKQQQQRHNKYDKNLGFPDNFDMSTGPMNGNVYVTENLHEAYHHYIKLITTNHGVAYQVLETSQLAIYKQDTIPEAKFIIDLSPIAVRYKKVQRHWYEYITSLMAIIGGTFTVVGIIDASMKEVTKQFTKMKRKQMPSMKHHKQQVY